MYTTPVEVHRRQFLHLIAEIKGLISESTDVPLQQSVNPLLDMLTAGIKSAATVNSSSTTSIPEPSVHESEESVSETNETITSETISSETNSIAKSETHPPKFPSNGFINIQRAQSRLELSEDDWEIARRDVQHAIKKKRLERESATPEIQNGKMYAALKWLQKLKGENGELKWPGFQGDDKAGMIKNFLRWEIHLMQQESTQGA